MALANVNLTDTFDVWRTRTNQLIIAIDQSLAISNAASNVANASAASFGSAFDKANSANVLAYNTGIGANAYATAIGTAVNAYMISVQNGSNTATGTGANTYLLATIAGANTAVGTGANAYAASIVSGIGTGANAYATSVGAAGNTYLLATLAGANTISIAAFDKANTGGGGGSTITIQTDSIDATRYVAFINATSGNASTLNVSSSGLTFNPSTGTLSATIFNSLSDESLKKDVVQVSNSLDLVQQLTGVKFTWKKTGQEAYGVIAQDVEKVIPGLVGEVDGIKNVNYDGIIAFLIEAIKELNQKLENK